MPNNENFYWRNLNRMNLMLTLLLTQNLGQPKDTNWTVNLITNISTLYFRSRGNLFVYHYFPGEPDDLVMERVLGRLHARGDFLITLQNGTESGDPPDFIRPKGIILFIEFAKVTYVSIITDFLMRILKCLHLNMKLIVVIQHHKFIHNGIIFLFLEKFWGINLRNVIIMNSVMNDLSPASLKIFYWRENFDFKKHSKIKTEFVHRMTLSMDDNKSIIRETMKQNDLFSLVNVEHIEGHFLNISVAVTPPYVWLKDVRWLNVIGKERLKLTTDRLDGIEVSILREFRSKYNLSGYFIIHPSEIIEIGELESQSEDTYGVLEETALGMSDIAIGGNLANAELYEFFGPSKTYFEDNMHWYVPAPKEIPLWKNLYLMFDNYMWSFIVIFHILISLMTFAAVKFGHHANFKIDFSVAVLTAWATELSQPIPPAVPDRMRILFIGAFIYGMHLSNFYQSGLITVLQEVYYETPIMTVEEALANNMKLCLTGISFDFFRTLNMSSQIESNFTYEVCLDYTECLDKVAKERHTIALVPEKTTEYTIPLRYIDQQRLETIRKMPERLISYPVSMYLTRASPYRKKLDFIITGLVEGGIIQKWWKDIRFSKIWNPREKRTVVRERGYRSISLRNETGVFVVYLLLMSISIAMFITENIWHKLTKWKNRKRRDYPDCRSRRFVH